MLVSPEPKTYVCKRGLNNLPCYPTHFSSLALPKKGTRAQGDKCAEY